jgi:hypothetical protein
MTVEKQRENKIERTNSYVWNSIRKGEMDITQTEWKRTGEKYSHAWLSENRDVWAH